MLNKLSVIIYGLFSVVVISTTISCMAENIETTSEIEPTAYIYKTVGEYELKLYVYSPEDIAAGDKRPAIVFFFGGGFVGGRIGQFEPHSRYLVSRGMVAITVDYRVQTRHNSTPIDSCADGRSAIRWVRANAEKLGIDSNRIVASGGSAGGCVAAMTGLIDETAPDGEPQVNSRPNAMVLFNPAVIYAPIDDQELRPEKRLEVYVQRWQKSAIPEISAWHHVNQDAPPTIMHHGDADTTCPLQTVQLFQERMQKFGVRCELKIYSGQGHGFFNHGRDENRWYIETVTATDRFLASLGYVEGEPTVAEKP